MRRNLYVIEAARKHELLQLLDLLDFQEQVNVNDQSSSLEEWQQEARRLELQGKKEQADDIRKQILRTEQPPWEVIDAGKFEQLQLDALDPDNYNKKAKDILFEYALIYYETSIFPRLAALKYNKADNWEREGASRIERKFQPFFKDQFKQVESQVRKYGPDFRNEFNFTPLMMAALGGSFQTIDYLLRLGADPFLKDNLGRQAFQIALLKSYQHEGYAKKLLGKVYHRLRPESLRVKVRNRLVKLSPHQMEFFMLNFMIALLREITTFKIQRDLPGFETADFLAAVTHYPDHIMPEYRKRRQYLSSILAKNEILRNDPYNRELFLRIRRGYYIINPVLEIEYEGEWRNIYDVTQTMKLEQSADPWVQNFGRYLRETRKRLAAGDWAMEGETGSRESTVGST